MRAAATAAISSICCGTDTTSAAASRRSRGRRAAVRALAAPDWRRSCRRTNFRVGEIDRAAWPTAAWTRSSAAPSCTLRADRRTSIGCSTRCGGCCAPEGMFFARLASNIGIEGIVGEATGRRSRLPDGIGSLRRRRGHTARADSSAWTASCSIRLKTTNVQKQRCMTTWCVRKRRSSSRPRGCARHAMSSLRCDARLMATAALTPSPAATTTNCASREASPATNTPVHSCRTACRSSPSRVESACTRSGSPDPSDGIARS